MKSTIAFHHFGCKVNFAEASALSRQFKDHGYILTGFHEKADIYVISTCVVTSVAEKKCKTAIRQAHRLNPDARIAVIGCFPELKSGEVASMPGVDVVLGHSEKFNLLNVIEKKDSIFRIQGSGKDFIPACSSGERTRAFLKIQDGCDYYCAYCTIPLARGNSRSDTIGHLLREAEQIVSSGIREIVLTGVNIGDFGKPNGESLFQLLLRLEKEIVVPRIRLSSIEPDLLSDEILDLVAGSRKFLPHFHLPMQSGSNRILRAMKRKYTRELYADRIERIRSRIPYACIAGDVIAGFPSETKEDFNETVAFLEDLAISYFHVFSYSRRDNTLASKLPENCSPVEKKRRSDRLHDLSFRKKKQFYESNKGREVSVLFESDNKENVMHGFSENYIRVKIPFDPLLVNEIRLVKLIEFDQDMTFAIQKNP